VLYYASGPLQRSLAVAGEVNMELWIASSAPDTDFIGKLCVVETSGRVTCLALGSLRARFRDGWSEPQALIPGAPTRIRIQMGHLAYVFPERSKLAVIITSSSFPRILPHPNTMAPTWRESAPQVAKQQLFHGPDCASHLELPVMQL
jgi:putative CocE/NonD family hydrolase